MTLLALSSPWMVSTPLLKALPPTASASGTLVKVALARRSVVLAGTSSVVSALRRP